MKQYIIESKSASGDRDWSSALCSKSKYDDRAEAEDEFERLDDMWGHNTYHRLIEVKRKVLRER